MKQFLLGAATASAVFGAFSLFVSTSHKTDDIPASSPTPIDWNLNNYGLGLGAYFIGDKIAYYPDMGPFRIVHLKPAIEFKREDLKSVCFSFIGQDADGTISSLQTDIHLHEQASENFLKILEAYPNKELSFELGPYKVANFTPDENSADNYKSSWSIDFSSAMRKEQTPSDFSFSANYSDIPEFMHLLSYLSPENIPEACGPAFDPSIIKQWKELTDAFWGGTKRFL